MNAEILAPAGSPESLLAAVRCGANAVYLGGKAFNARRSAANFNGETLSNAVKYCHARNVKVYLTLNTLVFDDELKEVSDTVENACAIGIDALIVQDLGVARLVRTSAPYMPLHASTQMSVYDTEGVKALEGLGFSRVVLARELSRGEIFEIKRNTNMELECFIHGALCMCVSGQCYFSAMLGGRSGNRGLCAQPCRLPFSNGKNEYALSLKDLSLIERVSDLIDAGAVSLKIEGRMKRPEYVSAAVSAVKQAMSGGAPDMDTLGSVFSRDGFTSGYFDAKTGPAMFGTRRKKDVAAASPALLSGIAAGYKEEKPLVQAALSLTARHGAPVMLTASDNDGNSVTVTAKAAELAKTAPTTREKAVSSLSKTGGTPFFISNISTDIGDGLMIPASGLNALRRNALDDLLKAREEISPRAFEKKTRVQSYYPEKSGKPRLRVRIGKPEQLTEELADNAELIIVAANIASRLGADIMRSHAKKLVIETPRVLFGKEHAARLENTLKTAIASGIMRATAGNIGSVKYLRERGFTVHGDFSLNIANTEALIEYESLGLCDATLSLELTKKRIVMLGGGIKRGILAYGFLPLMITRNCPAAVQNSNCRKGCGNPTLIDRQGNSFAVSCAFGASEIFNCVPLYLADKLADFSGIDFITLYFTTEAPRECDDIMRLYMTNAAPPANKTRGLYYRGVE